MDFQLVFERVISSFEEENLRLLLEYQKQRKRSIDWELLDEYFSLFDKQALLATLKKDFS